MELTPPNDSSRVEEWQLDLLAWVDGQLDDARAAQIAERLRVDTSAQKLAEELQLFSPTHFQQLPASQIPDISAERWHAHQESLAVACGFASITPEQIPHRSVWRQPIATLGLVCLAGLMVFLTVYRSTDAPNGHAIRVEPYPASPDTLAGFTALPLANPHEVMIDGVSGPLLSSVVSYDAPILSEIEFAMPDEIRILDGDAVELDQSAVELPPILFAKQSSE